MTDPADDLTVLFESITGDTSVVERQRAEPTTREVDESHDDGAVDAIDYHGFDDVIDGVESVDA